MARALRRGDGSAAGGRGAAWRRLVGYRARSIEYADDEPEFLEDSGGMLAGRGAGGGGRRGGGVLVGGAAGTVCFDGGDADRWRSAVARSPASRRASHTQPGVVSRDHPPAKP